MQLLKYVRLSESLNRCEKYTGSAKYQLECSSGGAVLTSHPDHMQSVQIVSWGCHGETSKSMCGEHSLSSTTGFVGAGDACVPRILIRDGKYSIWQFP